MSAVKDTLEDKKLLVEFLALMEGRDIDETIYSLLSALFAISVQLDYEGQTKLAEMVYNLYREIKPSSELLQ